MHRELWCGPADRQVIDRDESGGLDWIRSHLPVSRRGESVESLDEFDWAVEGPNWQRCFEVLRWLAAKRGKPRAAVREIDIESCGKSRIPLNGQVTQLHTANLLALYDRLVAAPGR